MSFRIIYESATERTSSHASQCQPPTKYTIHREDFAKTLQQKEINSVLEHLASVDGISLSAFVSRVLYVSSPMKTDPTLTEKILSETIKCVTYTAPCDNESNFLEKVESLHTLCKVAATESLIIPFIEWMKTNSERLNDALASCLIVDCQELAQECCFTIAFLARRLHFSMRGGVEVLIDTLIRLMARALLPREKNVTAYRDAQRLHEERDRLKKSLTIFHPPPLKYNYYEVYHRLIGIIYYTLADLLYSIPLPELVRFFTFRIFRRREIARLLLFQILDSVTGNISEIREEAENLASKTEKSEMYDENIWRLLPSILYLDILRAYSEINIVDREYPNTILNILRAQATQKYPLMDEKTLANVEQYWEQYQFFDLGMERVPRLSLNLPSVTMTKPLEIKKGSASGSLHTSNELPEIGPSLHHPRPTLLLKNL
ncbi:unnamed protein product [Hydatigera taeniaeformis]|uniref:MIF4G domain-containing protein n=1 Tax=Hydatigena taeniaeformis TaxID=6205 RepID=A0A0R3WUV9_HYDTA|nr:unnamed protein product [Hydatigera taeniaeformis]